MELSALSGDLTVQPVVKVSDVLYSCPSALARRLCVRVCLEMRKMLILKLNYFFTKNPLHTLYYPHSVD